MNGSESDFNSDFSGDFKIGFIGFGLIGGSIARALKKINSNYTLIAYDYHKDIQ
jgi:prephenate dehydrogenase